MPILIVRESINTSMSTEPAVTSILMSKKDHDGIESVINWHLKIPFQDSFF